PKVRPSLYALGHPDRDAPVLVTGNYDLTVRRVVRDTRGLDAYLLVCDSRGINVWCAAGGGHFTAEKVIQAVKTGGVVEVVDHRTLILPQMAGCGVLGKRIEEETGWRARWGPMYATDIAAYLKAGRRKTDEQREARFPLGHRLEMAVAIWQVWAVVFGIATLVFARDLFWPALALSLLLFVFIGAFMHWIPGRDGFWKGVSLAIGTVGLFLIWTVITGQPIVSISTANASLGLAALALFVGADSQGGSPLRRGGEFEHIHKLVPLELLLVIAWLALTFAPGLVR
ncbi:MAG: hypothetical protein KJ734_04880, partial [Chloroflexi bacterium]|nr:hypothetical protein [Chloroflexota bacterium]